MSPAATPGYEWQPRSWRKLEQSVCKLPKRNFRAARRPKTAPFVDGRARYPRQGPPTEEPCAGKLARTVLKASGGPRGPSLSQ